METTTVPVPAGLGPQRWTPETMFTPGSNIMGPKRYSNEFIAAQAEETYWEQIEPRPVLTREQAKKVGLDEQECLHCKGNRSVRVLHRGQVTGIEMMRQVECFCRAVRRFWWNFKHVDSRFRDASLKTLEVSEKVNTPPERQAEIHRMLNEYRDDSYLLIGSPGGGKTHLMAALFQRAVMRSVMEQMAANDLCESVWWASTSVLLNEHVEKEREKEGEAPEPYVTERKIRLAVKHGWRPRLFLDEIDKIAVTDFKIRRLGEIVNAIYAVKGQVCATMNKTPDALAVKWKDEDEAGTILRRIGTDEGGHTIHVG